MDALLASLGAHVYSYAIKSGIALTSSYALQQCSRLLQNVNDKSLRKELKSLQKLLDSKIRILSPAIDLIEFKSGRGNVFLESAVPLAKSLHREIVRLGKRLDDAASVEEGFRRTRRKASMPEAQYAELMSIVRDIRKLLERIDRDIPLIQLAITASGEKMSTSLTPGISPSRMMQASAFLFSGDAQFSSDPTRPVQIGPSFTLSLYMLFLGHSQDAPRKENEQGGSSLTYPSHSNGLVHQNQPYGLGEGERKPIWQEVMHKARVRLCRTPVDWAFDTVQGYSPKDSPGQEISGSTPAVSSTEFPGHTGEYSYHLEIIEDLDDGRVHDEGYGPAPFDGMPKAGIRDSLPIYQISKIFYTDTGRILNIGNSDDGDNNPVLLIKRDVKARTPVRARQEWFDGLSEPEDGDSGTEDESSQSDDQAEIDRQLREESELSARSVDEQQMPQTQRLPPHLDPEWLALEVFVEDDDSSSDNTVDENEEDDDGVENESGDPTLDKSLSLAERPTGPRPKSSIDSNLLARIRNVSLRPTTPPQEISRLESNNLATLQTEFSESYVSKSPFGGIITSLSLLEMMIRLTSLQEFQQTSHLSIPDHILTFFLEETSTTGLRGEARLEVRKEARRRVGFDPYTDTPKK
ncbi:RanGTP-binding protein-domain-containing protein [Lasiosphaeria miniovina]|uniref:RanGTP-binding protein-domain-containing protein n=1 Tax=Lasiosphaeria miniovina TaxID=1954250 RepID=A0AA40DQH9_9PEZI|nr:RanGTP-binding protein-domain-containing protein [Lasiosphaeria miniovina]KAK0709537.1 RanGTP-binding protein-domain-containing protein [Lasiosphaeria miniovina]